MYVSSLVPGAESTKIRLTGSNGEVVTTFCHVKDGVDSEFVAGFENGEIIRYREEEAHVERDG